MQCRRLRFDPCVRKIPWRRAWYPTTVFLLGKFHGQRSLEGCSLRDRKELDRTEVTEHTDTNHRLLASPPRVSDSGGLE